MTCRLAGIGVPGGAAPWKAVGFTVVDDAIAVANGALLLGAVGLVVADPPAAADLEGVPLAVGEVRSPVDHENGAFELDHVVVLTDSLERTSAAVEDTLGLECRRIRETPTVRQAFHRFDSSFGSRGCIIEVVERAGQGVTGLMGVVFNVADLGALADRCDDDVMSRPKDAVQPGRQIASFRRETGLPLPVALMTPG
jgi:hypothetical protein